MKKFHKSPVLRNAKWQLRAWQLVLAMCGAVSLAMCSPSSGDDPDDTSPGGSSTSSGGRSYVGEGGAASQGPRVSASNHPGWQHALCLSCHGSSAPMPHAEAYQPYDCVACHGYNGAPHRDHAVLENSGCASCHAAVEHVASFQAPQDCVKCHYHPESPDGT